MLCLCQTVPFGWWMRNVIYLVVDGKPVKKEITRWIFRHPQCNVCRRFEEGDIVIVTRRPPHNLVPAMVRVVRVGG